ncbi:MAG TPA: hypothetical protein VJZ68_08300 [Nitrososphaera sp.]|nr:hypothetical protein [Nitrososphaera sp.]
MSLEKLVEKTDSMTGTDIAAVVNTAAMAGGGGKLRMTEAHLEKALQEVKRTSKFLRDTLA